VKGQPLTNRGDRSQTFTHHDVHCARALALARPRHAIVATSGDCVTCPCTSSNPETQLVRVGDAIGRNREWTACGSCPADPVVGIRKVWVRAAATHREPPWPHATPRASTVEVVLSHGLVAAVKARPSTEVARATLVPVPNKVVPPASTTSTTVVVVQAARSSANKTSKTHGIIARIRAVTRHRSWPASATLLFRDQETKPP